MKAYLGDSVYAELNEREVVLTTENGYGPSNRIILNAEVYRNLTEFVESIKQLYLIQRIK